MNKREQEIINIIDGKIASKARFDDISNELEYKNNSRKKILFSSISLSVLSFLTVILIVMINIIHPSMIDGKYKVKYVERKSNSEVSEDACYAKRWDEKSLLEKYYEVSFNDLNYSLWSYDNAKTTDQKYIGEKIGEGIASGYDIYLNEFHYLDVEIYNIKKVKSEAAICVKFTDENLFYSMCNDNYDFKTIGDFINDLNLKEYASLTPLNYTYFDSKGNDYDLNFDVDSDEVFNNFFSDTDKQITISSHLLYSDNWYTIAFNVEAIGRTNLSLICYFDGTIVTNLFSYGRTFYVGSIVNDYFDYVNKKYEGYIVVYKYN